MPATADQSEPRTKRTAARDAFDKKMKEILTPEQFTKFQAMPRGGQRRGGAVERRRRRRGWRRATPGSITDSHF